MNQALAHLRDAAVAIANQGQSVEILPGIDLLIATSTTTALPAVYAPMAIVVFDGAMEVNLGQVTLDYVPGTCFVGSIDLPVTSRVTAATQDRPYMAIRILLDRESLADLIAEALDVIPERGKCYALGPASDDLLDACRRLLSLADQPREIRIMGPMLRREILFRLLSGPQAAALHQIVVSDPRIQQVRRALTWIRDNLDQSVPIKDMATCAGMSQPSFHRHFRAATGLSPLQYQKTLRLQAARRAILAGTEVSRAAFSVGYESPSQFSREYARMFGLAPTQDTKRWKNADEGSIEVSLGDRVD